MDDLTRTDIPLSQLPVSDELNDIKRDEGTWHRVSAIAILYFVEKFIVGLVNNIFYMIPMFIALWDEIKANPWIAVGIFAVIIGLIATFAVLSYVFFRYRLAEGTVEVKSGIFFKKHVNLPFNRIQNVKLEQPFYYRMFKFAAMAFDSGGSLAQEAKLVGLPLDFAKQLQTEINNYQFEPVTDDNQTDLAPPHVKADEIVENTRSITDLIFHGITSNRIFIILAGLSPFVDEIITFVTDRLSSWGMNVGQTIESESMIVLSIYVVSMFLFLLGVVTVLSIIGAIIMFYGFTLSRTSEKYIRRSGLITKHEISVPFSRIQVVIMKQDWLDIVFGRFNLKMEQLNGQIATAHGSGGNNKLMIPSVFAYECRDIIEHVFPKHHLHDTHFHAISKRFITRYLIMFWIPMSVLIGILGYDALQGKDIQWVYPITIGLIWSLLTVLRWWRWGYAYNTDYLYTRKGLFGADRYCLPIHKIQRVTFSQSWVMAKAGLASLKIQLASGSYSIPMIDAQIARQLQSYILNKVEVEAQPWM